MSLSVGVLEQSFELVKPHGPEFVASFYETLFASYPDVQPLFAQTNMADQQQKLLASLILVIENLRRPEQLTAALQHLGARHEALGIHEEHYAQVGAALLQTFPKYLGSAWTSEVEQAWTEAYGAISSIMLAATEPKAVVS